MAHPCWPLFDLRVRTPRLELRYPDDDDCVALALLAAAGIHDPEEMPFGVPWTDVASPELERRSMQHYWMLRANTTPDDWTLPLATVVDGVLVGTQAVSAKQFPLLRTVETGSWLGRRYQGQGIGKEMRSAILHLAFDGLGAVEATTGAWHDNAPSLGVTRSLGYEPNGELRMPRRDAADVQLRFRLTREAWARSRRDDVVIEGLDTCFPLLGLEPAPSS